jgi:hypothetical protein
MLNWSTAGYKFTFGIGALSATAMMAELWKPLLPTWFIITTAIVPWMIFVCVRPGQMPLSFVRAAHIFAASWYLALIIGLLIGACFATESLGTAIICLLFCSIGLIPSMFVLSEALRGRYGREGVAQSRNSADVDGSESGTQDIDVEISDDSGSGTVSEASEMAPLRYFSSKITAIRLTRTSEWKNRFRGFTVFIDGQQVGEIKNGESLLLEVSPGDHELFVKIDWCKSNEVRLQIPERTMIDIACGSGFGKDKPLSAALSAIEGAYVAVWPAAETSSGLPLQQLPSDV